MTLSCMYCGRTILNNIVYNIHLDNCTQKNNKEDDKSSEIHILITSIVNTLDNFNNITSTQILKLLQHYQYSISSTNNLHNIYIEKVKAYINENMKRVYSINCFKNILLINLSEIKKILS